MDHINQRKMNLEVHGNVISIFGTLPRVMKGLLNEMNTFLKAPYQRGGTLRHFRSRFCKLTREFNELSFEDLAKLLQEHPEFPNFREKFPCVKTGYYNIDASLIKDFEEDSKRILEFCRSGMLWGIGFPSYEFTKMVAEVCEAQNQYAKFEEIYSLLEQRRMLFSFGL